MVADPADKFEKVRRQEGEAAAARALISGTKRLVVGVAALVAALIFGALFLLLYSQGRVDSCRTLVDNDFDVAVGVVLVEYRETGQLSDNTAAQFDFALDAKAHTTEVCRGGFWPWQLPNDPPSYSREHGPALDTHNGSTPAPSTTALSAASLAGKKG